MNVPILRPTKVTAKLKPMVFSGINMNRYTKDDELSDGVNLSSKHIPAISPRESREALGYEITAPKEFFIASNGKKAYVDGTNFVYDGTVEGTVIAGEKSIVEFNNVLGALPK